MVLAAVKAFCLKRGFFDFGSFHIILNRRLSDIHVVGLSLIQLPNLFMIIFSGKFCLDFTSLTPINIAILGDGCKLFNLHGKSPLFS